MAIDLKNIVGLVFRYLRMAFPMNGRTRRLSSHPSWAFTLF